MINLDHVNSKPKVFLESMTHTQSTCTVLSIRCQIAIALTKLPIDKRIPEISFQTPRRNMLCEAIQTRFLTTSWRGLIPLLKLVQPKTLIKRMYMIWRMSNEREKWSRRVRGWVNKWAESRFVVDANSCCCHWKLKCSVQSPYLIHLLQSSQPLIGMCAKLLKPG